MNRTFLKIFPLILSQAKRTENTFFHSDCAGLNVTGQWAINKCFLKNLREKSKRQRRSLRSSAFSLSCCRTGLRGSCSSLRHPFPPPIYGGMWRSEMIKGKQEKKKKGWFLLFFCFACETQIFSLFQYRDALPKLKPSIFGQREWEGAVEG